ncbi:nuclear transport factor 2 family protein [Streptomyces brasiliscabiei]|uniref:nuclear transport factor 2 family protein n=1 Tax=Streptomyces brasiliscabiei TaxID=2736302 RepID=UPI001C1278ED|nr:nuclear transport factor 2 family protein [Streptomyces brasiliscabiei]
MSAAGNKALVIAFYEQAFNQYKPEEAAAAHLGETYTQHNPEAQDGPQAFVGYVHWLRGQFPDLRLDIKRAIAEGDLVVTHSNLHLKPGDRGMAVADFWRVADGRIVEHWDVIQEVPEKSANDNTMF